MARDYAEETSALKTIQTLNTAQVQYNSQFGRFARSLTELGPSASNLISADLAAGEKYGFKFTLTGTPTGYTVAAAPAFRSARIAPSPRRPLAPSNIDAFCRCWRAQLACAYVLP